MLFPFISKFYFQGYFSFFLLFFPDLIIFPPILFDPRALQPSFFIIFSPFFSSFPSSLSILFYILTLFVLLSRKPHLQVNLVTSSAQVAWHRRRHRQRHRTTILRLVSQWWMQMTKITSQHCFALLYLTEQMSVDQRAAQTGQAGPANYLKRAPGKPDPWFRVPASVLGSEELS